MSRKWNIILLQLLIFVHSGMLSKSRGQVLRLAAVNHVLFSLGSDGPQDDVVSENAIKAAIDFIHTACQQAAYIAGRGGLEEEILRFKDGNERYIYTNKLYG